MLLRMCALLVLSLFPIQLLEAQKVISVPQASSAAKYGKANAMVVKEAPAAAAKENAGQEKADQSKQPSAQENNESKSDSNEPDKAPPKSIQRSDYKPKEYVAPIPVEPDENGHVKFNFHGTPWPVVLDWLARYSRLNFDWQELPGDYLNLRTQQAYSAIEARDILNRHLLSRGYTLLQHGELLTAAKVQGLNPGLVPRVEPEDLPQRMPHEYVKVSLPLDWILADEAVEQLKPMLSSNGQLHAITSVNRLEAMDVAINLQEISRLLSEEQQGNRLEKGLVREFKLQHVRATHVIDSLYAILGVRKPQSLSGASNDISGSMSMQIMQQLQQMQQRMQGGNQGGGKGKEESEPKLVLNERENSILAHASPDKMEIIEQTIQAMDVPSARETHILQNLDRMKVYRLSTLKPDPLVKILTEIGDLSPTTKIQTDTSNNSIVVYGSLADHVTVQALVDRLDGSSRNFEVIPLRRLRAAEVAGTIQYMMGAEEEETDTKQSRYFSYFSYGRRSEPEEEERPFRVDADIENNRLLVWANDVEISEIQNLLIKMGEIPSGEVNPARSRMIDLYNDEDATRLIEQIQRVWEQQQNNELKIIPKSPQADQAPQPEEQPAVSGILEHPLDAGHQIRFATDSSAPEVNTSPLGLVNSESSRTATSPADRSAVPPVIVRQLPDGKLALESDDPRALDELEFMISELAPPAPDYKIYHIKYAWPFGIELNLLSFFESEDDEEQILDWWGNSRTINKTGPDRLSTRRKLKIISDDDSRTVLVQGASPRQLSIIEDLIEIYDRPESSDPQAVRMTKVFHLEYSQAAVISETVKSVYRDLLSANDPALQSKTKEGQQPPQSQGITFAPYRQDSGKDDKQAEQPQEPIKFKGLLSIGVDEISNTLVVSAASGLMADITELIQILDIAAKPDTAVQVLSVNPQISPSVLRDRLHQSFGVGKVNVTSTKQKRSEQDQSEPIEVGGQQFSK